MGELVLATPELAIPEIKAFSPKLNLSKIIEPYNKDSYINADNDLAAINAWLNQHKSNPKTYDAYKREVERLLLWCIYIKGITIAELRVEDFSDYFEFLKMPPQEWCITRKELREGKQSPKWRPFLGPLNQTGVTLATRALNSMMTFLVDSHYLKFNPIKLAAKPKDFKKILEEQKYNIWNRMLERDEWDAIQTALENMPEGSDKQIYHKIRVQFLFAMLYFLGLRIHELANHSWNAFRIRAGQWYFFVRGKGDKLAHIPVHSQLLSFVKIYRLHLGKTPLPDVDDLDLMIVTKRHKKALSIRQIFEIVKDVGKLAASQFAHDPLKQQKLLRLSPHWLRHLLASHLDKAEVPATMIQSILRHSSLDVTNIYMHAEELQKSQELQKLTLQVTPKVQELRSQKTKNTGVILTISLTKGPVCNEYSLMQLIEAIEQIALKEYKWESNNLDPEQLLKQYQQCHLYKQPFIITYTIYNISDELTQKIYQAIINEADVRLFNCIIKSEPLNFED